MPELNRVITFLKVEKHLTRSTAICTECRGKAKAMESCKQAKQSEVRVFPYSPLQPLISFPNTPFKVLFSVSTRSLKFQMFCLNT